MSALQQFTNQGPPPPPIQAPAATLLDQPSPEQLRSPADAVPPWDASRLTFTQLIVVDLALQGFEKQRTISYQHTMASAPDEQFLIVEHSRPLESLAHHVLSEMLNKEAHQDPVSKALEQAYVFADRREILPFIKQSRIIEELLIEAQEPLSNAFGRESVKKLTLVEDDEGFVTLFCLVLVPGSLDDARHALRSFDENWWLARSGKVGGKLNFDFELI